MAAYRKRGTTWRAEVNKAGMRISGSFDTKAEAVEWATKREAEIASGTYRAPDGVQRTLDDAIVRYMEEVSPGKRGGDLELIRLGAFRRDYPHLVGKRIAAVSSDDMGRWRDGRVAGVMKKGRRVRIQAGTINRELNLLSSIFERARIEWKWVHANPVRDVRRMPNPKARDRRIGDDEVSGMLAGLGYTRGQRPENKQHELAIAFLFALETGMRLGEILGLEWERVMLEKRYLHLPLTKNGGGRAVPLSTAAIALLALLAPASDDARLEPKGPCFTVSTTSADAHWRRARNRAKIVDLHFHDARHEAVTRLAKKLDVMDLARMIGHRDLKSLMVYYNATPTELAARLG
ncbi:site-specific integrase [Cupriavidus basilensis]|uniref:site-specific integrase n=1 Tax=Cupriavidus basilensis TaxID=68895 RepID=UPI0020A627CA|nr:site-specific integrase [Cupriavidus basilensis]MCP3022269.1 site-specific integrase [Cupriavidus basilensis]